MPGTSVRAWGYDGQVPGPELRVREGDRVRVTLRNRLPVPTTIHWHGLNVPPAMDGPAGLNQAPVEPGAEFVYEFTARPAGTRWYHSHADPALQVPLGLYGPLIVEPRVPLRTYDREYTYILQEWDLELTPDVATGGVPRGPGDRTMRGGELGGDLFLLNGHSHGSIPPVRLAEGDRVLIRLINAGHMPHAVHLHGHSFKIVATDGNPVPLGMEWVKDTVLIGPAERYDLEFVGDNPGVWMFHCHMEHHMANGMMTLVIYDGAVPTGPAAAFFDAESGTTVGDAEHSHEGTDSPESESTRPAPTPTTPLATTGAAPAGNAVEVAMVDDRFEPNSIEVTAGTTVTWVNRGQDWHSLAAYDGSFESRKLATGETFSVRFDEPGVYQYICKHHGLQGMMGRVTVA
jgi:FtsP/CotA-like multicopper oxidase with cupredoxin domain